MRVFRIPSMLVKLDKPTRFTPEMNRISENQYRSDVDITPVWVTIGKGDEKIVVLRATSAVDERWLNDIIGDIANACRTAIQKKLAARQTKDGFILPKKKPRHPTPPNPS